MCRSAFVALLLWVTCPLAACGERADEAAPPRAAPAAPSKASPPIVRYEWPRWSADLQPDVSGAQPGWDIHAPNPYGGTEAAGDQRQMRVHVTPGANPDGSIRRVLSVHFRGPPGRALAAHAAYVSQSLAGWKATRSPDDLGYSFASSEGVIPMPETGLVFIFLVRLPVLETALWRDAKVLLSNDASMDPQNPTPSSLVGSSYSALQPDDVGEYPIMLPFAAE